MANFSGPPDTAFLTPNQSLAKRMSDLSGFLQGGGVAAMGKNSGVPRLSGALSIFPTHIYIHIIIKN